MRGRRVQLFVSGTHRYAMPLGPIWFCMGRPMPKGKRDRGLNGLSWRFDKLDRRKIKEIKSKDLRIPTKVYRGCFIIVIIVVVMFFLCSWVELSKEDQKETRSHGPLKQQTRPYPPSKITRSGQGQGDTSVISTEGAFGELDLGEGPLFGAPVDLGGSPECLTVPKGSSKTTSHCCMVFRSGSRERATRESDATRVGAITIVRRLGFQLAEGQTEQQCPRQSEWGWGSCFQNKPHRDGSPSAGS